MGSQYRGVTVGELYRFYHKRFKDIDVNGRLHNENKPFLTFLCLFAGFIGKL